MSVRWTRLDEVGWEAALKPEGTRTVAGALRRELPDRLADALAGMAAVPASRALAQLGREERVRLIGVLVRGELPWTGDEGYKKAEVTGGGVSLAEIDPRTMESRKHPGLFLCGELLDAFGPIGGYNFLWAWATGRAPGLPPPALRLRPDRSLLGPTRVLVALTERLRGLPQRRRIALPLVSRNAGPVERLRSGFRVGKAIHYLPESPFRFIPLLPRKR